jgi:hypothetical protein
MVTHTASELDVADARFRSTAVLECGLDESDRGRYLRALRAADAGDPGPLGELLARAVLDNYLRLVLPAVAGPHRLVPLSALTSADVTLRALRNAAARGRLVAARGDDGLWRSTRKAVDDYLASRYERVPGT